MAATILDAAGVDRPDYFTDIDGQSLLQDKKREALHGHGRSVGGYQRFLVHGDWKYIRFTKTGEEQLFNLKRDPQELHDCSGEEDLSIFRDLVNKHRDSTTASHDHGETAELFACAGNSPKGVWLD